MSDRRLIRLFGTWLIVWNAGILTGIAVAQKPGIPEDSAWFVIAIIVGCACHVGSWHHSRKEKRGRSE